MQPYCHCHNVAEVAVIKFKAHFVDNNFPIRLWDKLLLQAELTINLLQQANVNPKLSAYAYLFSPFDYNRLPLAPLGLLYKSTCCPNAIHPGAITHARDGTLDAYGITIVYIRTSTT